ncbi:c6 zinc finger domain-containing protein [Thelonectria olida]|uniref:C6 zinc finger domain-containing protein n=1 Tax=Thelonectria olida TaxID=1576542 RepID=A0A9P8VTH8_9HYPO|nr:c6 zinc finger domain-containing protein [Thelonectria olida]
MPSDEAANSTPVGGKSPTNNPETTPLRSILRARQQARSRKSCFPCRERKVRCNRNHPCLTCCKRGHPDLCQYQDHFQPPTTPTAQAEPLVRGTTLSPVGRAHNGTRIDLGSTLQGLDSQGALNAYGNHVPSPGETPANSSLLGGRSILAMTRQNSLQPQDNPDRQRAFETGILPLLGIGGQRSQTTADVLEAYPCTSLPSDEELLKLFEFYRDRVNPFQFKLFDLGEIEKQICGIIVARTPSALSNPPVSPGGSHFLALLHAILACGAQFSDLPADRRLSLSQKHSKQAFDLLRATNYLSKPRKEGLQTLLLLGNILQNDMNPQAAWILGGTTIRLALSLGIQNPQLRLSNISSEEAQNLRLALVWQDALLSLAFDRPPSSHEMNQTDDLLPMSSGNDAEALNYRQAMNRLCCLMLTYSSLRSEALKMSKFAALLEGIDALEASEASHLRNRLECSSIQQIVEHYSFELHKNFALSTLCRPIVSKKASSTLNKAEITVIMGIFLDSLKRSARAFIQLHSTTSYARRSWAFVHNGLASALLLSFMADTRNTAETKEIQTQLIRCLGEGERNLTGSSEWGGSTQLSNPHKNCLQALQKLSKLSEDDNVRVQDEDHGSTEAANGLDVGLQNSQSLQTQGPFDMDSWLRTFDLDNYSPLEAFDFIMSDRDPFTVDVGNIAL